MAKATALIDVRSIAPPQRHPLIFGTFDALASGESLELANDHDPMPLYFQFEQTRSSQFTWHYLESGPVRWLVRIARVTVGSPSGPTSGCGGGSCGCAGGWRARAGSRASMRLTGGLAARAAGAALGRVRGLVRRLPPNPPRRHLRPHPSCRAALPHQAVLPAALC